MLQVRDFYVPLIPFGTEEEERQEEEERLRKRAEAQRSGAAAAAAVAAGGAEAQAEAAEADSALGDADFLAALESLKTTPEERALRLKDKGNEALSKGRCGRLVEPRRPGSSRAGHLRRQAPSRSRTAALWAPEQRCGRSAPSSATLEPLPHRRRRHRR